MNARIFALCQRGFRPGLLALAAATCLAAAPAVAEHRKVVGGLVINIGVVPAAALVRADAYERSSHPGALGRGTHHLVVSVADESTGRPVGDGRVTVELVDPKGSRQSKMLIRGDAGGFPDYSEVFRFGWTGSYQVKVNVERASTAPVRASFSWTHAGY
jgi:hypothetical protein